MAGAALMIGHQVAGKAVRDSFFLTHYPASALPRMGIAAAATSLVLVLVFSALMRRLGPGRLVPAGFLASAIAHFVELSLGPLATPRLSVVIYLHIVGLGAILLSGFWSLTTETFDPRTAKNSFGRIMGAGTIGGILGGSAAALLPPEGVVALLGGLHLLCAVTLASLPAASPAAREAAPAERVSARELFRRSPYLARIAAMVLTCTASAAILDYLFKAGAGAAFGKGAPLLRFFAVFYLITQVLTFAAQTFASRPALRKYGIGPTISSLPLGVGTASLAALFVPAFPFFAVARSLEQVLRGSLFRSAYELLYTPVPPAEKRAAKTLIDVACDRAGDALGMGVAQVLLVLGASYLSSQLLGIALALAAAGFWIAMRLDRGYSGVVQQRLVDHAVELDLAGAEDSTTRSIVLSSPKLRETPRPVPFAAPATRPPPDPALTLLEELRSGDRARVLSAIKGIRHPEPMLSAQLLRLLAWDDVAAAARAALLTDCSKQAGLLIDHLTDQDAHFAIRRRIPPILATCDTPLAVSGLLAGLEDSRFEVRFQCSRALDALHHRNPGLAIPADAVFAAVERELAVARPVWESRRLLDQRDQSDANAFLDEYLLERAHRSLEHVFSLFAAVLPREPVKVAFRAIHTDDKMFRGLAFEFLDGVLPAPIRERLWELIERPPGEGQARPPQEAAAELLRSHQSLLLRLGVTAGESGAPEATPSASGAPSQPGSPHTATRP